MVEIIKFQKGSTNDAIQNLGDQLQIHATALTKADEAALAFSVLKKENADLQAALKQAALDTEKAVAEAKKEGVKEAEEQIKRDETEALAKLKGGIKDAQKTLEQKLQKIDILSIAMAQATLDSFFHPAGDYKDIVAQMIAAQMKGLRRKSVLAINVSPKDFTQEKHLENLAEELGAGEMDIFADPDLEAGDCILDLRIGQLEFSASGHWNTLVTVFKSMASEARDA